MKRLISISATMAAVFGMVMIWVSFGTLFCVKSVCLLVLGAAAIWAAMHYTLGKNPYGYRGLGDISVFIFFGIVSVAGAYFVISHTFDTLLVLLPAAAIGCFSVGVLNVNNIRDMDDDRLAGKRTIPVRFGKNIALGLLGVIVALKPLFAWLAFGTSWAIAVIIPATIMYINVIRAKGARYNICLLQAGIVNLIYVVLVWLSI
jgi:1,4-dihydroxy-2-naphthoate octaprenyltransferase